MTSQVEIASSNSPFGYVLKDRNRHDPRMRPRDTSVSFQKNLKDLVQTHLNARLSGHSRNSGSGFIDYTDLWVHNPQTVNNENDFHSQNSQNSDSNENPHYTDLWVHNPQRSNNENIMKKTKAAEKWDKARDMVFCFERKIQESSSANLVRNRDINASSGPVLSSSPRGKSPDNSSSGPVSTSQRGVGRFQEGASSSSSSSEAVLISCNKRERSPDESASFGGPVTTSQRGRNWEVVSSRLLPSSSQRRKGQDSTGIAPGHHDSRSQRETSPVQYEASIGLPPISRAVSSLVQKWRHFEAEAKSSSVASSPLCISRSNSVFYTDTESLADAPVRGSDACEELIDLRPTTPTKTEDMFFDWELESQTGLSGPPSTRASDATENEKIRVADIIKKLTSNGDHHHSDREPTVSHESLPRVRTSLDKSELLRSFTPVSSSPRIRGRQAYCDLLVQIERDREKELEGLADSKAVSRFSHRGRIQAMLRVRFLRRGTEEKDNRNAISTSAEPSRLAQSAIKHIRQRFNEGVQRNETDSRSQQGQELIDKGPPPNEEVSAICQETENNRQQELTEPTKILDVLLDTNLDSQKAIRMDVVVDINHQEPNTMVVVQQNDRQQQQPTSDVIQQATKSEYSNQKPDFTLEEAFVKNNLETEQHTELEESEKQKLIGGSCNEFISVIATEDQCDHMEDDDAHQNLVSDSISETVVSEPFSGWEELENYYEHQAETNQDWIYDVSRPRSDWEDLRQARYQEMLDPFMENNDIRELLKRKSVSSFLSSGLRDSIDRLMMSRTQKPPSPLVSRVNNKERTDQVEEEEAALPEVEAKEDKKEYEEEGHEEVEKQESSKSNGYEKDVEDEIQSEQDCNHSQDYAAGAASWDNNQDHYFGSTSYPSPHESHTFSSTFTNRPSIEMQFMYEMRGNMEQLHQEVSELRRSINSCISMQMKLQNSISQDALSSRHSGRKKRRDSSVNRKSRKGRCCICYEMQIDTLLYRCGHMCTCFKCAQDLQWSSGKCPICEAPIMDVVRAYAFS